MISNLGSLLNVARSGLAASQTGVQVSSHNIANAEVEGYHKQTLQLQASDPYVTPQGVIGTGVTIGTITRATDRLLDNQLRSQTGLSSNFAQTRDLVSQVESAFGEPSDSGLGSTLDAFWSSWSALANSPTDSSAKATVRNSAQSLVDQLHSLSSQLSGVDTSAQQMLGDQVAEFNRQASSIASLNAQIVVQEAGGQTAGDLRDQRDQALKALSQLANVNVIEQPGGSVNVYIGTYRVVDGSDATTLKVSTTDPNSVLLGADPQPLRNVGGQIGATTDALTKTYPAITGKLDAMAAGLVTAVNTLHATGWTQSGGTNVDFFDPTGTTAATIDLSSAVKSDPSQIAAGTTVNGPGDNTLALAMAQLRSQKVTIGTSNASITEFYADMVSDVGFQVANADASATVHQTLAQQAQTRLQSETGASVDEELMSIMRFQQAYQAAAKVVTVADEMTQTLLNMYTPTA